MEDVYWPLWGCAEDWVKMVVKCIVGLFWGTNFQHGGKFDPQNSPTMHFDNHLVQLQSGEYEVVVWCNLFIKR